jgi:predicted small secreted protein
MHTPPACIGLFFFALDAPPSRRLYAADSGLFLSMEMQPMTMRKLMSVAAIAGVLLASACNTVEGLGKDVKSAGEAVEDAAK